MHAGMNEGHRPGFGRHGGMKASSRAPHDGMNETMPGLAPREPGRLRVEPRLARASAKSREDRRVEDVADGPALIVGHATTPTGADTSESIE